MLRQEIRIGDYTETGQNLTSYPFVTDLYKAGVDFPEHVTKEYSMIRRYSTINNVIYDTDLYIIENGALGDSGTVFPVTNTNYLAFSLDIAAFNPDFSDKTYQSDEVYLLSDSEGNSAAVECDKVRIYHPDNKTDIDAIVHIDTQVRGVRIHLLCRPYNMCTNGAENDFSIGHARYSEYIECWIPNIEKLLSGDVYYNEHITATKIDGVKCTGLVPLKVFSLPFRIEEETTAGSDIQYTTVEYTAVYKDYISAVAPGDVSHDYVTYPIRITLAPYTYADTTTQMYVNGSTQAMNSCMLQELASMRLCAKTGFDADGRHCITAVFDFPGKDSYSTFAEAYEHYYNVDLNDYTGIVEYDEDDDSTEEDNAKEQKQCGFVLDIYSDAKMTQRIARKTFTIGDPKTQLNDFAFQTAGMFSRWEQLPQVLVFQCMFVDRWLGNKILSNPVIITEETFKYFINSTAEQSGTYTPVVSWENGEKDMNTANFNFIDKISCTVRKSAATAETLSGNRSPRVLYKPVFYRTQDLQNISVRAGLVQNIGINLAEYMTKVETFVLAIGSQRVTESARNDIYVIFSVDGTALSDGGTYHISNQDGEYISSGKYTVE